MTTTISSRFSMTLLVTEIPDGLPRTHHQATTIEQEAQ
jgi:hypothetical protein